MYFQTRLRGINKEREAGMKPVLGYELRSPARLGEGVYEVPMASVVNYACENPKLSVKTVVENKVFLYHGMAGDNGKRKLAPDNSVIPIQNL